MNLEKLFSREDPFLTKYTLQREDTFALNLVPLNFQFAVTKIDPRYGTIRAMHTAWGTGKPRVRTMIELVDC